MVPGEKVLIKAVPYASADVYWSVDSECETLDYAVTIGTEPLDVFDENGEPIEMLYNYIELVAGEEPEQCSLGIRLTPENRTAEVWDSVDISINVQAEEEEAGED